MLVVPSVIGLLLGAVPAMVMEFIQPMWEPSTITAFGMPMLALGMAGFLVGVILEDRAYRASMKENL